MTQSPVQIEEALRQHPRATAPSTLAWLLWRAEGQPLLGVEGALRRWLAGRGAWSLDWYPSTGYWRFSFWRDGFEVHVESPEAWRAVLLGALRVERRSGGKTETGAGVLPPPPEASAPAGDDRSG